MTPAKIPAELCHHIISTQEIYFKSPNLSITRKAISSLQEIADDSNRSQFINDFLRATLPMTTVSSPKKKTKHHETPYQKTPHEKTYGCFIFKWIKAFIMEPIQNSAPSLWDIYQIRGTFKTAMPHIDEEIKSRLDTLLMHYAFSLAFTLSNLNNDNLLEDFLILSELYDLTILNESRSKKIHQNKIFHVLGNATTQLNIKISQVKLQEQQKYRCKRTIGNENLASKMGGLSLKIPVSRNTSGYNTIQPPPGFENHSRLLLWTQQPRPISANNCQNRGWTQGTIPPCSPIVTHGMATTTTLGDKDNTHETLWSDPSSAKF